MLTNIRAKQLALEKSQAGYSGAYFSLRMVSTADRRGFGKVTDGPWTTFAAKIIREAQATVVPFYFHGCNSRPFHVASHLAQPLRTALLLHEAANKFGKSVRVEVGAPLPWEQLQAVGGRSQLTEYLYNQVQALAAPVTPVVEVAAAS